MPLSDFSGRDELEYAIVRERLRPVKAVMLPASNPVDSIIWDVAELCWAHEHLARPDIQQVLHWVQAIRAGQEVILEVEALPPYTPAENTAVAQLEETEVADLR